MHLSLFRSSASGLPCSNFIRYTNFWPRPYVKSRFAVSKALSRFQVTSSVLSTPGFCSRQNHELWGTLLVMMLGTGRFSGLVQSSRTLKGRGNLKLMFSYMRPIQSSLLVLSQPQTWDWVLLKLTSLCKQKSSLRLKACHENTSRLKMCINCFQVMRALVKFARVRAQKHQPWGYCQLCLWLMYDLGKLLHLTESQLSCQ